MMTSHTGITVLILAGHRQGRDPICQAYGIEYKALAPVAGQPMITHPLQALLDSKNVGEIIVLSQDPAGMQRALADHVQSDRVQYRHSSNSIADSVMACSGQLRDGAPLLVTTADNCLLTGKDLDQFISDAMGQAADVVVGFASRERLLSRYPAARRTWIRFRDTALTGCNLYWLGNAQALQAVRFWKGFEASPKKIFRMAWQLGPRFFWRYWRGSLSADVCFRSISQLCDAIIRPVHVASPEVSIDADKLIDIRQIESILLQRVTAAGPVPKRTRANRPLVIFDLDRTITTFGTYTPFLVHFAIRYRPLALLWTPLLLLVALGWKAGLASRGQLKSIIFHLLVGRPSSGSLEAECEVFVERTLRKRVYVDALAAIKQWREKGAELMLATASYDWLAKHFAQRLGFHQVVATRSIDCEGRVVAGIRGQNCYGEQKSVMVNLATGSLAAHRARGRQIWFYTDHHSDTSLLEQCDFPVAVNPTRKLRQWADQNPRASVQEWQRTTGQTGAVSESGVTGSSVRRVQNRRLRVLFVHRTLRQSGAARQIFLLYRSLDRRLFDPTFVVQSDNRLFFRPDDTGLIVLSRGEFRPLAAVRELSAVIRRVRPDIIQSFNTDGNLLTWMATRGAEVPVFMASLRNTKKPWYEFMVERQIASAYDGLVVNSSATRTEILERLRMPEDRIRLIHNGVDTGFFRPYSTQEQVSMRHSLGVPADAFVMVSVGRITRQKNHECMLHALADLQRRLGSHVPLVWYCLGLHENGRLYRRLLRFARELGIGQNCRFIESVVEIPAYYAVADISVLCSFWEGMPNALLESMACARIPIVSASADNDAIIRHGNNGFLFDGTDPSALADLLEMMWTMPSTQKEWIAKCARNDIVQKYSTERMVEQYSRLYLATAGVEVPVWPLPGKQRVNVG